MKYGKSNIDILRDYVAGNRPFVQVGFTGKTYKKRKIGDTWTDKKGITWEQKQGGPVRINRVAEIIKQTIGIDKCISCNAEVRWGSKSDVLFYKKTKLCTNCLVDYETKLRFVGLYDDYEKFKLASNELGYLKDMKAEIKETIGFFESDTGDVTAICNGDGYIERWKNTNRTKILSDAKTDLKLVNKRIVFLSKIKSDSKKKFMTGLKKYKLKCYV